MLHNYGIQAAHCIRAIAGALALTSIVVASCNNENHPPLAACVPVARDAGADATLPDGAPAHVSDASVPCVGPTGVIVGGPGAPGTGTNGNSGGTPAVGTIGSGGTDNGLGGSGGTGGTTDIGAGGVDIGFGTGGLGSGGINTGLSGSTGFGIPGGTLPGFGGTGF